MSRSRRSVLATVAGGAALVAGCNSSDTGADPTADPGTPTVTFVDATGESATSTPTETPDGVERALVDSRADLETAIERLDAAAVVEDGAVGFTSEDAFAEYARTESRRGPITDARERLDAVSDRASGARQRAVNGLLFLCEYLETRAAEQDAIVDGFSAYYEVNRAFPGDLKLDTAGRAVAGMRKLGDHVQTAESLLDRLESRAEVLGVPGFAPGAARERQRTVGAIGREFAPGFAGTRSVLRAVGLASATAPAIERGNYERAERFASATVTAAENARESTTTAFDRGVRHFRDAFEQDRCLAAGLRTVGARYAASARAFEAGDTERGRERYRAAKEALATTEAECGIEL